MRGRLKTLVLAGTMVAGGLGIASAGPAAAAATPLSIDTSGYPCASGVCSLGLGNVGMNFQNDPFADGGTASGPGVTDYGWSVVAGSLPPGLSEEVLGGTSAMVFGTPTKAGTFSFTLQVTDNAGNTARQAFSITIGTGNLDRVVVTAADYTAEGDKLVVDALDANTAATLTVSVTSTGTQIGTLNTFGTGGYDATVYVAPNPVNITVTSSLGGSGTLATTLVKKPY
jgi:Putative Ig domain